MTAERFGYYFVFVETIEVTNISYQEVYRLLQRVAGIDPTRVKTMPNRCGMAVWTSRALGPDQLAKIISLSGYIKYAGRILLLDDWEKINETTLCDAVHRFAGSSNRLVRLLAYTVEGFPNRWPYNRSGMLGARFYRSKFFMSDQPVTMIFKKIRSQAPPWNQLNIELIESVKEIPGGSDRQSGTDPVPSEQNAATLFLIRDIHPEDRAVGLNTNLDPGSKDYSGREDRHLMILMESGLSADNIVHHFGDIKPYWPERVTTPPSLMAAAINLMNVPIDGSGRPSRRQPVLMDPFVGTGTAVFEGLKYPVKVFVNDYEEATGLKDNLFFFCRADGHFFQKLVQCVEKYLVDLRNPFLRNLCEILSRFYGGDFFFQERVNLAGLTRLLVEGGPVDFSVHPFFPTQGGYRNEKLHLKDRMGDLRAYLHSEKIDPRIARLMIYMTFRVVKERYVDVTDGENFISESLLKNEIQNFWSESKTLLSESGRLHEMILRLKAERNPALPRRFAKFPEIKASAGDLRTNILYSEYDPTVSRRVQIASTDITAGTWRSVFPAFDFMVTDIPYSFNQKVDDIGRLYDAFVELINRKGRTGAEVVVITLDKVKSGQNVAGECFAERLVARIEKGAGHHGRRIARKHVCYWKSNKALNRQIVHFQLD